MLFANEKIKMCWRHFIITMLRQSDFSEETILIRAHIRHSCQQYLTNKTLFNAVFINIVTSSFLL